MSLPVPDVDDVNRLYFEGTAKGELRIRHCPRCNTLFRFAHAWCPSCWSQEVDYKVASGRGRVETFTIIYQAPYEFFESRLPYVLALIELDEGVRMMSNIVGCDPAEVRIGSVVTVTYEERGPLMLPMFMLDH